MTSSNDSDAFNQADPGDEPAAPRIRAGSPLAAPGFGSAATGADLAAGGATPSTPPLADPKGEMKRVLKRLMAIMFDHVQSAQRMELPLAKAELDEVLAALQEEADGRDAGPLLQRGSELAAYVKQSLFDELLGEPSNVFVATRINEDTMRYEPMPKQFWQECLGHLRESLQNADAEILSSR